MQTRGDLAARAGAICAPLLIFLALAAYAGQASEPKSRIRYAEPMQIQASKLPGSAGFSLPAHRLS
jgi:hypothetical protein